MFIFFSSLLSSLVRLDNIELDRCVCDLFCSKTAAAHLDERLEFEYSSNSTLLIELWNKIGWLLCVVFVKYFIYGCTPLVMLKSHSWNKSNVHHHWWKGFDSKNCHKFQRNPNKLNWTPKAIIEYENPMSVDKFDTRWSCRHFIASLASKKKKCCQICIKVGKTIFDI